MFWPPIWSGLKLKIVITAAALELTVKSMPDGNMEDAPVGSDWA
jgi:hypothetical protein